MINRRVASYLALFMILAIPLVLAEQVLWDDDSDIEIYDTWRDVDGTPLTGASCSWQVYNLGGGLNQSGVPTEFSVGIINFTVNQLQIGIYPMLINCTKSNFNGTSSKDSIKVIDELAEELKDRLINIQNATSEINSTTQDTKILADEINITTHATYDLLVNDINITLTQILALSVSTSQNLSDISANLTSISTRIDSILSDTGNIYSLLLDKWGSNTALDILDEIDSLQDDILDLEERINDLSNSGINQRLLSIQRDSSNILNRIDIGESEWKENLIKFGLPALAIIFIVIILVVLLKDKDTEEEKVNKMAFQMYPQNRSQNKIGAKKHGTRQ